MQWVKQKQTGFTIVELLIVVVVIAILAAITIVSYNGISQRSKTSMLQSELASASKAIEYYKVNGSTELYPDTLEQAGVKLPAGNGTTYGYTANNSSSPATFCMYGDNGVSRYVVTNASLSPKEGNCTITNLVANPNFSTGTTGWSTGGYGTGGVATSTRTAGIGPTGGYAMRTVWTTAATASSGHSTSMQATVPIVPGRTYTASAWVRPNQTVNTGVMRVEYSTTTAASNNQILPANTWTRVFYTFVANQSASGVNLSARIQELFGTTAGFTFDATNYMLTEGPTLYTYADGSFTSNGWSWTGTAGASQSTGPAL